MLALVAVCFFNFSSVMAVEEVRTEAGAEISTPAGALDVTLEGGAQGEGQGASGVLTGQEGGGQGGISDATRAAIAGSESGQFTGPTVTPAQEAELMALAAKKSQQPLSVTGQKQEATQQAQQLRTQLEEQAKAHAAQIAKQQETHQVALTAQQEAHKQALADQATLKAWQAKTPKEQIQAIMTSEAQRFALEKVEEAKGGLVNLLKEKGLWEQMPVALQQKVTTEDATSAALGAWQKLPTDQQTGDELGKLLQQKLASVMQGEAGQQAIQQGLQAADGLLVKMGVPPAQRQQAQEVLGQFADQLIQKAGAQHAGAADATTAAEGHAGMLGIRQKTAGMGAALASLGGLGALGGVEGEKATQGGGSGKTDTTTLGEQTAAAGETIVPGLMLDLSKLTMPSLLSILADLQKVIIAAKPVADLSDQLLKAITVSIVMKVQDSFNISYAAIKGSAVFNLDGTIEQINAKILQDGKDLKSFFATFGELIYDIRLKNVTVNTIKTTMATVEQTIKDNFTTLFTTDMVAQFVTLQQKVPQAELKTLMGRVNTTVQSAIDQAGETVDTTIAAMAKRDAAAKAARAKTATATSTSAQTPAASSSNTTDTQVSQSNPDWNTMVNE